MVPKNCLSSITLAALGLLVIFSLPSATIILIDGWVPLVPAMTLTFLDSLYPASSSLMELPVYRSQ